MEKKLKVGKIVVSEGIRKRLVPGENGFLGEFLLRCIFRHEKGDWGSISDEEKFSNDEALEDGGRIFSSYNFGDEKIWIITEADRSATTILFPDEY